jgi:hypothetical protein
VAVHELPLNTGHGFTDHLLYVDCMAPGIIEAMKEGATLSAVEDHSYKYSQGLPDGLPDVDNQLPFEARTTAGLPRTSVI